MGNPFISGSSKGSLLSTLGLHGAKMQQRNFISGIQKTPPKHGGNPSTQFKFGVLGTVLWAPLLQKYNNAISSAKSRKSIQSIGEIRLPNSDFGFWGLFKRNVLSVLGVPPAKMQQRSFISKIPKTTFKILRKSSYPICLLYRGARDAANGSVLWN